MGKTYKIAVMPGDGTGPEVVAEGLKVLQAAAAKSGAELAAAEGEAGNIKVALEKVDKFSGTYKELSRQLETANQKLAAATNSLEGAGKALADRKRMANAVAGDMEAKLTAATAARCSYRLPAAHPRISLRSASMSASPNFCSPMATASRIRHRGSDANLLSRTSCARSPSAASLPSVETAQKTRNTVALFSGASFSEIAR